MKKIIAFLIVLCLGFNLNSLKSQSKKDPFNPRMRVIIDNDFAGDPDGLFQLVQHIMSPSVEIRGIIGSHLKPGDVFDPSDQTATNALKNVNYLLDLMKCKSKYTVCQGSNFGLKDANTHYNSAGAQLIVNEAMRTDVNTPLYVVAGGGLTEIASAYLLEPRIADKIVLIWIGGTEYPDLAVPPPGYSIMEYNTGIDLIAAQIVFNKSNIPLWQVPRNVYRQTLMSYTELLAKVKTQGKLGKYLFDKINYIFNIVPAETYIMGDSPLVLLTALQSIFEPDPSSSFYVIKQVPIINDKGLYVINEKGRNIRVYTHLDNRLMFEDFYAKLNLFNQSSNIK